MCAGCSVGPKRREQASSHRSCATPGTSGALRLQPASAAPAPAPGLTGSLPAPKMAAAASGVVVIVVVRWRRHVGAGGQWASSLSRRPGAGGGSASGRRLRPGCGPCRLHNSLRAPRGPTFRLPAIRGCAEPHDGVRGRRLPSEVRAPGSGLR